MRTIFLLVVLEKSWLHPNNQHWVSWAPWTPLMQQGSCSSITVTKKIYQPHLWGYLRLLGEQTITDWGDKGWNKPTMSILTVCIVHTMMGNGRGHHEDKVSLHERHDKVIEPRSSTKSMARETKVAVVSKWCPEVWHKRQIADSEGSFSILNCLSEEHWRSNMFQGATDHVHPKKENHSII